MKIAIPINEDKRTIGDSFGRVPLFAVWNSDSGSVDYLDNSAAASQGGAGIKAAQLLVDADIEAVLTPRCGENATGVLQAANISLYKSVGDNMGKNLAAFEAGELEELTEIYPGLHQSGE